MAQVVTLQHLFGASSPWSERDWTASDDRVRGGKSQSYLDATSSGARFHGELDIDTLGGAGFASQRTADDNALWNLAAYDGLQLMIAKGDGKRYTFIVKDVLLPPNASNGREQATTSWEYDFCTEEASFPLTIRIPWSAFKPTYRGREQKDAKPLRPSTVKRFSIMMRSFFGTQAGPFSLSITSISAYKEAHYDPSDPKALEEGRPGSPPIHRSSQATILAAAVTLTALVVLYWRWLR